MRNGLHYMQQTKTILVCTGCLYKSLNNTCLINRMLPSICPCTRCLVKTSCNKQCEDLDKTMKKIGKELNKC